jgi:hypothetical protein
MLKTKRILLGVVVTVTLLLAANGMRAEQKPSRAVWEYKIVEIHSDQLSYSTDVDKMLNEQGSSGWEFVSSEPDTRAGSSSIWKFYTFKRLK